MLADDDDIGILKSPCTLPRRDQTVGGLPAPPPRPADLYRSSVQCWAEAQCPSMAQCSVSLWYSVRLWRSAVSICGVVQCPSMVQCRAAAQYSVCLWRSTVPSVLQCLSVAQCCVSVVLLCPSVAQYRVRLWRSQGRRGVYRTPSPPEQRLRTTRGAKQTADPPPAAVIQPGWKIPRPPDTEASH